MDSVSFIRAHLGRMSDAQIMRVLGLRRDSDYRELRALAMVDRRNVAELLHGRGADRTMATRRYTARLPAAERALEQLCALAGRSRERIVAAQGDDDFAARDLAAWLLKTQCGLSGITIGRMLSVTEYAAGLCFRRYDNAIAQGAERASHAEWRQKICAGLARA